MHPDLARWLVSDAAGPALAAAAAEPDPGSLAAAARLRALVEPDRAAAALTQTALRRRARGKFGARAASLFLTPDGLEQATRAGVAARRAARLAHITGSGEVVDLGCGIGADALAFVEAGLATTAVELDPATAILAGANLGHEVLTGDATAWWPRLAGPGRAVFADPARRTGAGRSWRVEDLSPSWEFAKSLLDGARPACVKLGPGLPHALLWDAVEAEWVSDAGTVVECALWAGEGSRPGRRAAIVDGAALAGTGAPPAAVAAVEDYLYEADAAVIRAGLVDELAGLVRAHRLAEGLAYLSAPWHRPTPFATVFAVREVLPYQERTLRAWVREHRVGTLEIKKRGIDIDPAQLRRRLKPSGPASATLVLTPTASGAVVLVVERLGRDSV